MEPSDPVDRERLVRAVAGDRGALREIVAAHLPRIRRWALVAAGDPATAEDAVQEALIRVVRAIGEVDPHRPFLPWLKVVVLNAARSEVARSGRAAARAERAATLDPPIGEPRPGRALDLGRASARIRETFAALPPRQREILDRVDLAGESAAEVAADLGLTAGAVRGQLFQARRAVRSALTEADRDAILPLLREAK